MKKFLFALFCILNINFAYSAKMKVTDIYELAKTGNTEELAKVTNINGHDMYKDTALCHAIKNKDVKAYKLLLEHGAKSDHSCVKKIPESEYSSFMQNVAESEKTATAGFLGPGTNTWIGIGAGVAAVAAGAAIASSGGGSGGGSSGSSAGETDDSSGGEEPIPQLNCGHGTQNGNACICHNGWTGDACDTEINCGANFTQTNCGIGYIQSGTCQSGDKTYVSCTFDSEHYIEQGGIVYQKLDCGHGTQNADICVCETGWSDDNCATLLTGYTTNTQGDTVCASGYGKNGAGKCVLKGTDKIGGTTANSSVTMNNTDYADIYGKKNMSNASGTSRTIKITNNSDSDVYGIYTSVSGVYNASSGVTGRINITNIGNGNIYGIYGDHTDVKNASGSGSGSATTTVNAYITIVNNGTGNTYGMYGNKVENLSGSSKYGSSFSQWTGSYTYSYYNSYININNLGSGTAVGLYGKTNIVNSGNININNIGTGTVIGIFGESKSTITNSGKITITRNSYTDENNVVYNPAGISGDVFGIYAKTNSTINNSGNITINTNGTAYGIYVESGSTVTNTGTIKINGNSCTGSNCTSTNNAIVLNGSTLYNNGIVKANTLSLAPMKGKVVASAGSSFVVDNELSGDLHIDSDVVTSGNQTTYVAENMIDAGNTSGLNLISDSAMFDASLVGNDVVMQMKDFDTLTDNKSLAAFLKRNYENGNGDDLFATLKSMDNMSAFNGALMGLSGVDSFTQFAHEDLSALREISLSMNNKLFENSGRDNFDISDSMGYFSFSDNHNSGSGQYGISSSRLSDNWKLGYGMAMANIYTNDGDGFSRQNQMWMFYMPATYTNDDIELVITSQAGFTRGEYNRRGFNNQNYEGYIEKQIVGLMNDLRYPIIFGNWTLAPDLSFNAIMYNQSGHEDEQEFSLVIPNERMISVETGLGLYSKYEKTFQDGGRLKFTSGVMGYREYGDTYNIKLGMRGMDGTFDLYNNDYKYRAALNMGIDYAVGNFHMYGNTQYFMDNANYMNFKGGISYRF